MLFTVKSVESVFFYNYAAMRDLFGQGGEEMIKGIANPGSKPADCKSAGTREQEERSIQCDKEIKIGFKAEKFYFKRNFLYYCSVI